MKHHEADIASLAARAVCAWKLSILTYSRRMIVACGSRHAGLRTPDGGTQPDSTEIKSGLLPRFPGRRACEVNLSCYRACFVVWLVVVRTGVWTAQAIGHLHVWIMIRVRGNAGYSSLSKRFVSLGRVSTHRNVRETAVTVKIQKFLRLRRGPPAAPAAGLFTKIHIPFLHLMGARPGKFLKLPDIWGRYLAQAL